MSSSWKSIRGGLSRISAGSVTNVWGVNSHQQVYRYTGNDDQAWARFHGILLTDIGAAADGTVWGVNSDGEVFRYKWHTDEWTKIIGCPSLSRISVGSRTNVWGVNNAGAVFRYTGDDREPWHHIPGSLIDIGAGADGTVWGVSRTGTALRYTGDEGDPNHWVGIPDTNFSAISAGIKTNVWAVDSKGDVFTSMGSDKTYWRKIEGSLSDIGAGADGVVWGVNDATGNIFRWVRD